MSFHFIFFSCARTECLSSIQIFESLHSLKYFMKLLQAVTTSLLFRVLLIPLVVADLNSDVQALLDFASAVPHAWKLNWSPSIPICSSWVGITCNVDKTQVMANTK
ncbi:hypothetical protein BT93_D0119 [Corymbia citriodora subsp. variegata]|nr:hypothetical protein BT93_D0119 [Corymbia citriodora subsp. variegata]